MLQMLGNCGCLSGVVAINGGRLTISRINPLLIIDCYLHATFVLVETHINSFTAHLDIHLQFCTLRVIILIKGSAARNL